MRFLLDTNILSSLIRDPHGRVAQRIRRVGEDNICTSVIVAGELRFGAEKRGSATLTAQMEAVLEPLVVAPIESSVDAVYGSLRARLERTGSLIGANDLWIAAHALHLGCTLVTDNAAQFERVKGLRLQNWLR
jgi:tRNA(fMet)-specific endonuclease VapC